VLAIYLWEFRRVKREIAEPECGQTLNLAFTPDRVNDLPEFFAGVAAAEAPLGPMRAVTNAPSSRHKAYITP
jgi:hypothetical protein